MQTIEGLRLNNLCAQGAYSGVYWNDASFEEFSYVTGADSAEVGQGGMRVNMVPRDGGNSFRGSVINELRDRDGFGSDNCGSSGFVNGVLQPCTRSNLSGSKTFNANNTLTNVDVLKNIWDAHPSNRRSDPSGTRSGSTTPSGTGARPRRRPMPTQT